MLCKGHRWDVFHDRKWCGDRILSRHPLCSRWPAPLAPIWTPSGKGPTWWWEAIAATGFAFLGSPKISFGCGQIQNSKWSEISARAESGASVSGRLLASSLASFKIPMSWTSTATTLAHWMVPTHLFQSLDTWLKGREEREHLLLLVGFGAQHIQCNWRVWQSWGQDWFALSNFLGLGSKGVYVDVGASLPFDYSNTATWQQIDLKNVGTWPLKFQLT